MDKALIGRWAFIVGLVVSLAAGFIPNITSNITIVAGLVVLGVVVGFLNVTGDEVQKFLLGTVALMLVGGTVKSSLPITADILSAFTAFVAGAALIVALKEVYTITKSK